jgi:hypothetical protein
MALILAKIFLLGKRIFGRAPIRRAIDDFRNAASMEGLAIVVRIAPNE